MIKLNHHPLTKIFFSTGAPHTRIFWLVYFYSQGRWMMFFGNNIVITIIHRSLDADNLLFCYYYHFILIINTICAIVTVCSKKNVCAGARLRLKNKTVPIPIWRPPVGTSDHTRVIIIHITRTYYIIYIIMIQWCLILYNVSHVIARIEIALNL